MTVDTSNDRSIDLSIDTSILERVREYRVAARHAVEATDAGDRLQLLALLDLHDFAMKEPDRTTRLWCERAIWVEASDFVLGVDPPVLGDRWEQRQRQLRAQGYSRCPKCLSNVMTPDQLERGHQQRLRRIEDLERRKEATDRG